MTMKLEGRVAIVTGAAGGIGKVYAKGLAQAGAQVMVADIQEEAAAVTAAAISESGVTARSCFLDQSDPGSAEAMVRATEAELGPVDILVNNAGIFGTLKRMEAIEITPEEWAQVVNVNLNGLFYCCRAVLPGMIEREYGRIVNVGSTAIFDCRNQVAHYDAAKAGVIGLTRILAREYGDRGITANTLSPGSTQSGAGASTPEYLASKLERRSIRRIQLPEDLLGALLYLCSDDSAFMTGQNLLVDGGAIFQ